MVWKRYGLRRIPKINLIEKHIFQDEDVVEQSNIDIDQIANNPTSAACVSLGSRSASVSTTQSVQLGSISIPQVKNAISGANYQKHGTGDAAI